MNNITSKKTVSSWLTSEFNTYNYINSFKIVKKVENSKLIINIMKDKYGIGKDKSFLFTNSLLSSLSKLNATKLFGKGLKPGNLGEGSAKCWIFEIDGDKVVLFIDSRGSTWEFESESPKVFETCFGKVLLFLLENPTDIIIKRIDTFRI